MTQSRINHFTTWLLSIALVWTAVVTLGVPAVFAENAPVYRYARHSANKDSVAVRFSADTKSKKRVLKLRLPLQLRRDQTIVDGVFSARTGLLAALTGGEASIIDLR